MWQGWKRDVSSSRGLLYWGGFFRDFCTHLISHNCVHQTSETLAKYYQVESLLFHNKIRVVSKENSKEEMKLMQTVMSACSNGHKFVKTKWFPIPNAEWNLSQYYLSSGHFQSGRRLRELRWTYWDHSGPSGSPTTGKTGRWPWNHPHDRSPDRDCFSQCIISLAWTLTTEKYG